MMFRVLIASALIVGLSSCSNQRWDPGDYPVSSGDTIYSIAWKYELDPFELARWNNIPSPYRIYPGQRLKMKPGQSGANAKSASSSNRSSSGRRPDSITVRKGDTLYGLAQEYDISARQLASVNGLKSPYTIQPGQTLRLKAPATGTPAAPTPSAR